MQNTELDDIEIECGGSSDDNTDDSYIVYVWNFPIPAMNLNTTLPETFR